MPGNEGDLHAQCVVASLSCMTKQLHVYIRTFADRQVLRAVVHIRSLLEWCRLCYHWSSALHRSLEMLAKSITTRNDDRKDQCAPRHREK